MPVLPQFPLGSVLFPTMVLPLHVFELRYRQLVNDILDHDGCFGVVLIERGSEVGGGDQRTGWGTTAKVAESDQLPDGRWSLVTVGVERFRVVDWLDDDPYPRAEVEPWPDGDAGPVPTDRFRTVEGKLHRCLALASEAGVDTGPRLPELEATAVGTMQLSALLPTGPLDKHRLLGIDGANERLDAIEVLIDDVMKLIELNLSTEGPDNPGQTTPD